MRWPRSRVAPAKRRQPLGLSFDFILLSAVWMYVAPADRSRAFRKLGVSYVSVV
jgi:hypothetical protein